MLAIFSDKKLGFKEGKHCEDKLVDMDASFPVATGTAMRGHCLGFGLSTKNQSCLEPTLSQFDSMTVHNVAQDCRTASIDCLKTGWAKKDSHGSGLYAIIGSLSSSLSNMYQSLRKRPPDFRAYSSSFHWDPR